MFKWPENVHWKWVGVSAAVFFALLAGAAIFAVNGALKKAEPALAAAVQKALPSHAFRMGGLSFGFPLGVAASDVALSNPGGFDNGTLFQADSVKVRIRLLSALKLLPQLVRSESSAQFDSGDSAAGSVLIVRPVLFLERKETLWNFAASTPGGGEAHRTLPPVEIEIENGSLSVRDDQKTLDGAGFKELNGTLTLNPNDPKADIELRGLSNESVRISGTSAEPRKLNLEVQVRNVSLLEWTRRGGNVPENFPVRNDQLDADISADLVIPDDIQRAEDWGWSGSAKILEHRASAAAGREQVELKGTGTLEFSREAVRVKEAEYRSPASRIKAEGELVSPFGEPRLIAKVEADLETRELGGLLPPHLNPEGKLTVSASAEGPLKNASVSASARSAGAKLAGRPLDWSAAVSIASGTLDIRSFALVWGESSAIAKGLWSAKEWDSVASIKNLPLEYLYPKDKAMMGGKATLQLRARGSSTDPVLTGQISAKNFTFLTNKIGTLSGDLRMRENSAAFRLATPDSKQRAMLEIERKEPAILLKQLAVFLENGQKLRLSGSLNRATRAVGGELAVESLSFSTLGDTLKFLAPFDGKISANGKISGSWEEPRLEGALRGHNIFFRDRTIQAEPVENISSKFSWDKTALVFPTFSIGPSYSGKITVLKKPRKEFSVEAAAKDANPKILFALLGINPDVSGPLNGSARFTRKTGDGSSPVYTMAGDGTLKIGKGRWTRMPFDVFSLQYRFEGDDLKVTEFRMKQPGGMMDLTAAAKQGAASNPLTVQGRLQNFTIAKSRVDGPVSMEGRLVLEEKPAVSGKAVSEQLKLNRIRVGRTETDLEWKGRLLSLSNVNLGFLEGSLNIAMGLPGADPSLTGSWHSKPQPVEDWFELLQISTPPIQGKMSLSGTVAGTLKNPEVNLDYEFFNLKIVLPKNREIESSLEGLNGAGGAVFKDGLLKSLSATLTRQNNERLTVLGQANLQSQTLNLRATIHQINSNVLFFPLGLKKFQGPMDGTLTVDGSWSSPVIRGDVRGQGGMLGDMAMDSWDVAGTFREKEFAFTRLNARGQRGAWRFSILEDSWIRPQNENKSGLYRLNTDFANISIGPVFLVGSGIMEGNWNTDPVSGQPVFMGYANINECTANNFEIKPAKLILQYTDKKLRFLPRQPGDPSAAGGPAGAPSVTGEMDFTKLPCLLLRKFSVSRADKRIFFMDGELCTDQPAFLIEGNGVDASLLTGIFSSPLPMSGLSNFKIEGKKSAGATHIDGFISLADGKVFDIPLESLDSKFLWKDGVFNLASLEAKSKQYFNLSGSGRFPLALGKTRPTDLKTDLSLKCTNGNLAFLDSLDSDLVRNTKGAFSAQVSIKGTSKNPVVSGSLKVSDGEASSKYLGRSLQKADIAVQVKSNKISIQKAEAEIGGQKVQASGDAALVFDEGEMTFDHFNLKFKTLGSEGISIQIPELPAVRVHERLGLPSTPSKGSVIASLTLTGRAESPKIGGDVILNDVLFSYPPPKKEIERRTWFDDVDWDITLKTGKRAIFQNDVAYAKVEGQIKLNGPKDDLSAKGKLTSHEGNITFLGAKFELTQASLEMQPPARYTLGQGSVTVAETRSVAYLSLRAEQRKQVIVNGQEVQDTITMQIDRTPLSDKFDSKSITFRSSARPNLDSERVVSSAAGFETDFQNLTPEQKDIQLRQGMARVLDTQLASPLAKSILQTIGIADRIEITQDENYGRDGRKSRSADVRGEEASALDPLIGQTFLVEKTFASRLGVGYRATFDKIQDRADFIHQLQLRYPFYKGFYFIGSTELDSEENLGRQRERYGGIETRVRWDFSDLFDWTRNKNPEQTKPE